MAQRKSTSSQTRPAMRFFLKEWLAFRGTTPTELNDRGIVSRSACYRLLRAQEKRSNKFSQDTLQRIANDFGMFYEQFFVPPHDATKYTLRELLHDPLAEASPGILMPDELRAEIRGYVEAWLFRERRQKTKALRGTKKTSS